MLDETSLKLLYKFLLLLMYITTVTVRYGATHMPLDIKDLEYYKIEL